MVCVSRISGGAARGGEVLLSCKAWGSDMIGGVTDGGGSCATCLLRNARWSSKNPRVTMVVVLGSSSRLRLDAGEAVLVSTSGTKYRKNDDMFAGWSEMP